MKYKLEYWKTDGTLLETQDGSGIFARSFMQFYETPGEAEEAKSDVNADCTSSITVRQEDGSYIGLIS